MTDWLRLWHDMPADPKWRTIARKAGQRIGDVIAVFDFALVNASSNEEDRGTLRNFKHEDVATALDIDEAEVDAIMLAMEGRVIADGRLIGWEKRQPKREDNSTQRVRDMRERNRNDAQRDVTQGNASESETEEDTDISPPTPPAGGFDDFWNAYPEKVKQEAARKAFDRAIQKAPLAEILAGVARYIAGKPKAQAWKAPAGWLEAQRWKDHPAAIKPVLAATGPKRTWLEIKAEKDRLAVRQADDGSGPRQIASIAPTVLIPVEGVIS